MTAIKQETQKMIKSLPDDCTYEDIQYHLYVVEKIHKGLNRAGSGQTTSHKNAQERMSKWLSD